MDAQLTQTQRELLAVLPTDLSPLDLQKWKSRLVAFGQPKIPTNTDLVSEAHAPYAAASTDEPLTLSIPRAWLDDVFLQKLMNWLEFKRLAEASQLTEQQALALGKEAKQGWWEKNKHWVAEKMGTA